ncbi:MAG TPA: hypothetical protein VML94_00250 [Thermoplasmata archaeon]|nr:hypothetical protein [Thermoplasmata archaeon]
MPDQFTLLLEWRRNEAAGRGLAKLPLDYYEGTSAYLAELKRSYEADLRENPSGRKGEISRQTYQRASQVARDILEGRVQKILSLAFQASIGGARELPNALAEERAMFDGLLGILLGFRRSSAPYLETAAGVPPSAAPPAERPVERAASPPPPPPRAPAPKGAAPAPLAYVRVLTDGHTVEVGPDSVELRADDLIALPAATAKLLVDTKVAEPITVVRPTPK